MTQSDSPFPMISDVNADDFVSLETEKTSVDDTAIDCSQASKNEDGDHSVPPAIRIALTGQHLIEASAGTGKTWTLTGILLRLLIEAKRPPEQIIATTFTRAAAAEMRERVHQRLIDFYQVLQWVNTLQANPDTHAVLFPQLLQSAQSESQEKSALRVQRNHWLKKQSQLAGMAELLDDPINFHLVSYLLDHVVDYSIAEAIRRTSLVLTTLDRLFVGTLDSLAQKWLSEYSAETGYQKGMGITDDVQAVIDGIIHDELRRFQSQLYYDQPKMYQLLQQQGKLTQIEDHQTAVDKALTFISAPIDEVEVEAFDLEQYEYLIDKIVEASHQLEPFFNPNGEYYAAVKGQLSNNRHAWQDIIKYLKTHGINAYGYISGGKYSSKLVAAFGKTEKIFAQFYKSDIGEQANLAFNTLPVVKYFNSYIALSDKLEAQLDHLVIKLNRQIAMAVRHQLPSILEARNETTFTLQMVRLNQALAGKQGHKLARYIRHHYPVALIDESQDINGEQAQMIERIYLPSEQKTNLGAANTGQDPMKKGFLLLVGDPKQAIYGFRGGDVANYNYMKQKFYHNVMTLTINRRSNARLIDALNHWFGCPSSSKVEEGDQQQVLEDNNKNSLSEGYTKNNDQIAASLENNTLTHTAPPPLAELGDNIYYQHIEAHNQHSQLTWLTDKSDNHIETKADNVEDMLWPNQPVSIIHLAKDSEGEYDEFEITALHIAAILNSNHKLEGRPIQPSDIGVLGRQKSELKQVEEMLHKLAVPTLKTTEVSIFETVMAVDLVAVLEAMLRPYRRDMINRALTSQFFGLTLGEVKTMMASHDDGASGVNNQHSIHNDLTTELESYRSIEADPAKQRYQDFISYIKEASERWQRRGILSALHYLLGKNPINQQSIWQSLAALPEGERHIMDLRHLMDILAEYGMHMGEHELLSWYKQNMEAAPTSDWAKQQPLPTESGVQLMTIHKSKGLEFPIVYVLGMGSASKDVGANKTHGFYLYDNQQSDSAWQRRLSPVKDKATQQGFFSDIETTENYNERKRLGYVAFTRASEQLYIVLKSPSNKKDFSRKPMFEWLEASDPVFELPERLKGRIGWLVGDSIAEKLQKNSQPSTKAEANPSCQTSLSSLSPQAKKETEAKKVHRIAYPPLDQVMPVKSFPGWAKTSFTALARQLSEQSQDLAVIDERIDDDIYIDTQSYGQDIRGGYDEVNGGDITSQLMNEADQGDLTIAATKANDDIRFSFVKGANAGTFLHQIFEKIDFHHSEHWSEVIDQAVREYQLPLNYASAEQQARLLDIETNDNLKKNNDITDEAVTEGPQDRSDHQQLKNWIEEVLATPLLASNQPLKAIAPERRFAELGFNMGLSENFKPEAINQIFQQHLADQPDKHVVLTEQFTPYLYRYLRGEIDLVYEHAGKYYVVDYKSNYLGNSLSDYNEKTLSTAMSKAGYWLQAAIYQVALHRFLSIRIADYKGNEDKYLGAVEYVFLRGVFANTTTHSDSQAGVDSDVNSSSPSTPGTPRFGLVKWDIPIEFIKALDKAFGKPSR